MLCDNLEGCDGVGGGRKVEEGKTDVSLWLIHVDIWQKPTKPCKAIILQLKFFLKSNNIALEVLTTVLPIFISETTNCKLYLIRVQSLQKLFISILHLLLLLSR